MDGRKIVLLYLFSMMKLRSKESQLFQAKSISLGSCPSKESQCFQAKSISLGSCPTCLELVICHKNSTIEEKD